MKKIYLIMALACMMMVSCNPDEGGDSMGNIQGHDYVDLGLPSGVKWATCNIGANAPEEYGMYFAWGETSPKNEYTEENSLTTGKIIKEYLFVTSKEQYDAAAVNWGGTWRVPTRLELNELLEKCKWEWTAQNGVNGYKVVGPNGNSIFFPAAGVRQETMHLGNNMIGYYWTCTPGDPGQAPGAAHILKFNEERGYYNDYVQRHIGMPIRPVSL